MPNQQSSRIDLVDLSTQIVNKVGDERSKKYFYCLNRFLSQKLNKSDFDRSCCRLLGRDNLPLHNQLLRSILKNAYQEKSPSNISKVGPTKSVNQTAKVSSFTREDEYEQSGYLVANQSRTPNWPNGVLPVSQRKVRSGMHDRKLMDIPNPFGPNGKADFLPHVSAATEDGISKVPKDNGELFPCEYRQLLHNGQVFAGLPKKVRDPSAQQHCYDDQSVLVEVEKDVRQANHFTLSRSSLIAPLGIPFFQASVGGAHKPVPVSGSHNSVSYFDSGELSDTVTLRKRMEQIASLQDLEGVSLECANTLNHMLDLYLKRLIRSCVEMVGAGSLCDSSRNIIHKQEVVGKLLNGMWPNNHLPMRSDSENVKTMQDQRQHSSMSSLDFKVAMELNPQQLGEDWPLTLEKVCTRAFVE